MRKNFSVSTLTRLMKSCSCHWLLVITSRPLLHLEQKNIRSLSPARLTRENEASWCVNDFISLCVELGIADGRMVMSRPSQSSPP